jgi:predicted metal-binding membrane protein
MSAMGEMLRPEQTQPGAAASFLCLWVVMMVAMMLPSLVPILWRYCQAVDRPGENAARSILIAKNGGGLYPCLPWRTS